MGKMPYICDTAFFNKFEIMNKLYLILTLITLNLTYSAKIDAGTLSATDAQQDEWTVRFNVKNTEGESVGYCSTIEIHDENNNYVGYIYSFNPVVELPNEKNLYCQD